MNWDKEVISPDRLGFAPLFAGAFPPASRLAVDRPVYRTCRTGSWRAGTPCGPPMPSGFAAQAFPTRRAATTGGCQ